MESERRRKRRRRREGGGEERMFKKGGGGGKIVDLTQRGGGLPHYIVCGLEKKNFENEKKRGA